MTTPSDEPPKQEGIMGLLGKKWKPTHSRRTTTVQGYYFDPKHGGCFRNVTKLRKESFMILGVYGNDELREAGQFWSAVMTAGPESDGKIRLSIDFDGKEKDEAKQMSAVFSQDTKVITWEDGNKWLPCYCHPLQLKWNGGDGYMANTYAGSIVKRKC
jgi:hypothetical protein